MAWSYKRVLLVCSPTAGAGCGCRSALPVLVGPPAVNTGKFTVRDVTEIITLWLQQEQLSNSWKINGRICAYGMGFLATLC
jgi:hypothetical protein